MTLDYAELAQLHRKQVECGIRVRDDATEMPKHQPHFDDHGPRF